MTIGEAVQLFGAKRIGKGKYTAKCPAHDDRSRNTLSIREGTRGILIHCWAGCPKDEVLAAIGIRMRDLFYTSRDTSSAKMKEVYRQQYRDMLYLRERRLMDLRMVLKAVELKPYQRAKRCTSYFERDIEAMCQRLSQ